MATKKTTKKAPVAKKTEKKAAKAPAKKAAKASPAKAKEVGDLSAPQVRILAALAKAKGSLPRTAVPEKAEIDASLISAYAGYLKPEINDRPVHAGNLLNRGFVRQTVDETEEGKVNVIEITAAGRKALAKAQ